ncbi:MAG: trxA 2 [Chlamydiia bacterium]|nr:trxA 2 [Chlamydiia bacterium]
MKKISILALLVVGFMSFVGASNLLAGHGHADKKPGSVKPLTVKELTRSNINEVLKNRKFVVINVYKEWSPSSSHENHIFQQLAEEYRKKPYRFAKLNGSKEKELVEYYHITSFPTILFIKNQKEVARHVGHISKEELEQKMVLHFIP